MKLWTSLVLIVVLIPIVQAQECSCLDQLKWLIGTFEANDAGAPHIIERKGVEVYEAHNQQFMEWASTISSPDDCEQLLNKWTYFFRKGHVGVIRNTSVSPEATAQSLSIDESEFYRHIDQLSDSSGWEGIWESGPYTIGIIRATGKGSRERYVGFILHSEIPSWKKYQIKLEIFPRHDSGYAMHYYMSDHSLREVPKVDQIAGRYLLSDLVVMRKIRPVPSGQAPHSSITRFAKAMATSKPYIEHLSDHTLYLRIPSFSLPAKALIDSVLQSYHNKIIHTENLIIDLRGNGGGYDLSYSSLLPYLYTNPIRSIGVEFRSTPQNNQRMEAFIKAPNVPPDIKEWARKGLRILKEHLGEFVNLDSVTVSIDTFDSILPYPRHIAILIDNQCASTTEQFLLAARQSKKVKLFGIPTKGSLDISNLHHATSPCGEYTLWYALSRSLRISNLPIDGIGIQPDFYLDSTIAPHKWVEYADYILNYDTR